MNTNICPPARSLNMRLVRLADAQPKSRVTTMLDDGLLVIHGVHGTAEVSNSNPDAGIYHIVLRRFEKTLSSIYLHRDEPNGKGLDVAMRALVDLVDHEDYWVR